MSHSSKLPPTVYATADLPANPRSGDTVFDSDLGILKYWDGSQWSEVGKLGSVVAGTNVTIDNTDPINPIISAAGGGGGGTTLSGTTANDTQTEIYVDGTPTNRVDVATGSTITFSALVAARSATESAGYKIEGVIKNDAGTAEIVGVVVKTIFAEEDIAWDATVTAANNAITFLVTGDSVDSVSWEVTLNKIEAT